MDRTRRIGPAGQDPQDRIGSRGPQGFLADQGRPRRPKQCRRSMRRCVNFQFTYSRHLVIDLIDEARISGIRTRVGRVKLED